MRHKIHLATCMAFAKSELFDSKLKDTSALFKALSHPARLAILKYLAETNVCITGDICVELPLSRTTVNQHLTELKKAGLIQGTVDGTKVNYCLNPRKVKELGNLANCFFKVIDQESGYNCK